MRFWKEFWNPGLKCKRVGHRLHTQRRKIMRGGDRNYVARTGMADVTCCRRCGGERVFDNFKLIIGWTSCTLDSYMWNEIREHGFRLDD